ncbi:MAG TPA: ADOP family duplicated permease [Vicinamibacterales bacterium]|nr:ADOP family duplicated permease [Vicinamibacterales bacterium]
MGELWRRLWYLLNRARFERELREEMDAHRAMKRETEPRFGNSLRLREEAADEWGWAWLDRLTQDLRFACRLLWRAPAFTLTAISVLALGVGVNLAAFQVIDSVALSWLPVRSPETLVRLYRRSPQGTSTAFSFPAFAFYRQNASSLKSAIALVGGGVTFGDENRRGDAEFVTANYFSDLGATPLAGRLLDSRDEAADADAVIVLSERAWASTLGGERAAIGRPLRVNGRPFTLVGVVPRSFVGLEDRTADAWIPLVQHRAAFPGSTLLEDWRSDAVRFFARVHDLTAAGAAQEELRPIVNRLRSMRPEHVWKDEWLALRPAGHYVTFDEAAPGFALIGCLVGLVLIAACVNLGLLVLARTLGRDREFAVRLSVGATRGRIIRQLLTEHLLLGVMGASAGCFVAIEAARAALTLTGAPGGLTPHFNLRAVAVAALLAVVSSVLFGFAPAYQALRPAVSRRLRLRSILVGIQVAAASTLLIVAGLLVRGVTRVVRVPLGFDYHRTLLADPDLTSHGTTEAAAQAYWSDVETRIRAQPGVRNAALTSLPPFGNRVWVNREHTIIYHVTPAYFDTLRIALVRGRIFNDGEAGVTLVSEALARRRWPGEDAIGKEYEGATIIGVVGNARTVRISDGLATECYRAMTPRQMSEAVMVIRTEESRGATAATLQAVMRGNHRHLTPSVVPLQDAFEDKLAAPRRFALVASTLGICALLLAVIGLGGMVAFTVMQRTREIGVRMALGARPSHVVRAIARQFTTPLAIGAAAGSLLAASAGAILSRELFGVSNLDPLAHGGAFLLFAVVAALATLPSVRRAIHLDPVQTLRHE